MKKLYWYMLRSYLGPFVFTFFVSLFILLLQFLWKYLDDLVGKGLEWYIILKLMYYASSTFVPLALPLAILLSSLMTFGNMGEHYELVAIKSAGISLRKAMKPLIILAVFLSFSAFYFSNWILPVANLKFSSLLYDVRQQKLAFNLSEGIFDNDLDDFVIHIGRKDKDNKTIYDVKIYDHSERKGNVKVITAEKGIMELSPDQTKIIFTLFNGSRYTEITDVEGYRKTRPFEVLAFKKFVRLFDLTQFQLSRTNEELFKSHYIMLNIKQLNYSIDSLSTTRTERVEFYKKRFMKEYPYLEKQDTAMKDKPAAEMAHEMLSKKEITLPDTIALLDSIAMLDSVVLDTLPKKKILYPLTENFTLSRQAQIIDIALTGARSTKDNIIFYKNELSSRQQIIAKHQVVWHNKFKLSLACLIFFFIGAPLGAIIRKGGLGLPVVVSVVFFVIYHVISMTGEKAARTGEWDIIFGSWLSTVIILPLGLFLTYKATTDAHLLDTESWSRFFDKFKKLNVFKKK